MVYEHYRTRFVTYDVLTRQRKSEKNIDPQIVPKVE